MSHLGHLILASKFSRVITPPSAPLLAAHEGDILDFNVRRGAGGSEFILCPLTETSLVFLIRNCPCYPKDASVPE